MISDLQAEKINLEQTLTKQIEDIRAEYSGKERQQKIQDAMKTFLAKRTLTVSPDVALEAVMPSLQKRFNIDFDEKEVISLFDKNNPQTKAKKSNTSFASLDEELDSDLSRFNFIAKSKGSDNTPPPPPTGAGSNDKQTNGKFSLANKFAEAGLDDGTGN